MALIASAAVGGGGSDDKRQRPRTPRSRPDLKVGSDVPYPPFEFGKPPYEGFDVDVVNEIAQAPGTKATFEKTPSTRSSVTSPRASSTWWPRRRRSRPSRKKTVDFSIPYLPGRPVADGQAGQRHQDVDDLAGKIVGAQLGTTGAEYAKEQTKAKSVRTYDLIDDAFNAPRGRPGGGRDQRLCRCPGTPSDRAGGSSWCDTMAAGNGYGIALPEGLRAEGEGRRRARPDQGGRHLRADLSASGSGRGAAARLRTLALMSRNRARVVHWM